MTYKSKINDDERRLWVLNDEGLYMAMREDNRGKRDGQYSIMSWVRKNRTLIDNVILSSMNKKGE